MKKVIFALLASATIAGCTATERAAGTGAVVGGAAGAATGAIVGGSTEATLAGAAIGAGGGALIGAVAADRNTCRYQDPATGQVYEARCPAGYR